jgi:hypothetical protein
MIRLPDFRSIRGELYCVYRPCVAEQLAWEDGRSAALILSRIADMAEARTFEARIEGRSSFTHQDVAASWQPWPVLSIITSALL